MCIICNCNYDDATAFLTYFSDAGKQMRKAADYMLACSRSATTPEARKRYSALHKEMVRMARDWNRLEQDREKDLVYVEKSELGLPKTS